MTMFDNFHESLTDNSMLVEAALCILDKNGPTVLTKPSTLTSLTLPSGSITADAIAQASVIYQGLLCLMIPMDSEKLNLVLVTKTFTVSASTTLIIVRFHGERSSATVRFRWRQLANAADRRKAYEPMDMPVTPKSSL